MDLESLKKTSDLMHDIAVSKQNAIEKMRSRQVLVYNNHVFKADADTLNLVQILRQYRQELPFYILDINNNPCEITNSLDFLQKLLERNQESINAYHQLYQTFKKKG
jgi:hypothetical protein